MTETAESSTAAPTLVVRAIPPRLLQRLREVLADGKALKAAQETVNLRAATVLELAYESLEAPENAKFDLEHGVVKWEVPPAKVPEEVQPAT